MFTLALRVSLAVVSISAAVATQSPPSREGTIASDDGVKLYYRDVGSGPDVIVIPVALWTSPHFDRLAAAKRRLIYYDPRGRGRSETGDLANVSLDRATRDLEGLRVKLGIERMALIGWSGFGMEMAVYALAHPDRVTRIVQLNPVPPRQEPFMTTRSTQMRSRIDSAAWRRYQAVAKEGKDQKATCRAFNRAFAPAFAAKVEAAAAIGESHCELEAEWPDRQRAFFGAFMPSIASLDLRSRIPELTMPRLVIHGDRDLIPLEGVREWTAGAGDRARLLVIPGADHTSFIDEPDTVLKAIAEFLDANPVRSH